MPKYIIKSYRRFTGFDVLELVVSPSSESLFLLTIFAFMLGLSIVLGIETFLAETLESSTNESGRLRCVLGFSTLFLQEELAAVCTPDEPSTNDKGRLKEVLYLSFDLTGIFRGLTSASDSTP